MVWKEPNPKTISTILDWLVKAEMIEIDRGRGNRQYTLISIVNWGNYQGFDSEGVTENGEGRKQQTDINKNEKNEKNEKKKTSSRTRSRTYSEDDTYFKMAKHFFGKVSAVAEEAELGHLILKVDLQKWADEFRKLVEIDNVTDKHLINAVMEWVSKDSFWRTNCLSAKKFRDRFSEFALKAKFNHQPQKHQQKKPDPRDREIAFQQWIQEGKDPDEFDWGN
ncbi:hypothetical protein [Brevibacillus porteri]|uniref:hypothetical protein n=1 Tax=Brevibacillus porteri TaxID=2126350 RepID=UPI003D20BBF0